MIVGIDPGLEGGWSLVSCEGRVLDADALPIAGRYTDSVALTTHILLLAGGPPLAVWMERQAPQASDGPRSIATTMCSFGELRGAFLALGWPLQLVDPKVWKNCVLKGTRRDKAAAVDFARFYAPSINLHPGRRKHAHDGMADAICIGVYGHRTMIGAP